MTPEQKERRKEAKRRYKRSHPEKMQEERLKYKYGITLKDKEEIIRQQSGRCGFCKRTLENRKSVIDHDHRTGIIRGVLCYGCNILLGRLGDTEEKIMANVKEYINRGIRKHDKYIVYLPKMGIGESHTTEDSFLLQQLRSREIRKEEEGK